uniref:Uncharacterized protein n=1 Tax=Cucumis melo TaxID=3656 RepID=A0A9I9EGG9_CUCME
MIPSFADPRCRIACEALHSWEYGVNVTSRMVISDAWMTLVMLHWEKYIPDAVLVARQESVSRRISSGGLLDVFFCIEN